ncbi:MAG: hypothetical protein N2505_06180 [Endomicrobia bacterium]|nr:hypothetical protein [Endomicrobiia bacterium]
MKMKIIITILFFFCLLWFSNTYDLIFQSPVVIKKRIIEKPVIKNKTSSSTNIKKPLNNDGLKKKTTITSYPKYLSSESFELRSKVLSYINLQEEEKIAFDNIIKKESGYDPTSLNEIGAGGLCQAYPYTKMNCKLSWEDWRCQVDWCIKYIRNRYKNSIDAWNFHLVNNWF